MATSVEAASRELAEKTKVIAHLTQTLAHTRACLDIARAALESIADENGGSAASEADAHRRKIALETLARI